MDIWIRIGPVEGKKALRTGSGDNETCWQMFSKGEKC